MRRLLATMPNCAPALLALFVIPLSPDTALSDSLGSSTAAPATPAALACTSNDVVVYEPNPSPGSEPACAAPARTTAEVAEARAYVIETASPGFTMTLQGAELAIGRLHPEFVVRLANAIREARSAGLPFAGVFSAYRPPAFGVGGFSDKFNSLHTYGLAVDMNGIGRPGSSEAQLWHETAARNGVVCPYGPRDRAEWNHCQPTSVKIILAANPLRETVRAEGPSDLESMFEAGNTIIEDMASAAESLTKAAPTSVRALEANATGRVPMPQVMASRGTKRRAMVRLALGRGADKPARHAKDSAGIGVGGPIIAVEEGRRTSSVRQAKHGTRIIIGPTKITVVERGERTSSSAKMSSSAKKAKPDTRVGARGAPVIAVEESRRKSKSGRG
ncbi:MAG TPA: hypothetical protein VFJ46_02935 [Xanthobacteraceae bacterium]|nr:hypothetical protein [Xanthobacteraceae bacterium]